jgi:hypothetical protein
MVASMRKPGLVSTNAKYPISFVKEQKTATGNYYFAVVELVYSGKELETIRAGVLTKDPQQAQEKVADLKDADIQAVMKKVESCFEKYHEIYTVYMLNLECAVKFLESCLKGKRRNLPFKMKIPWNVFEQVRKHTEGKEELANGGDVESLKEYLEKLTAQEDRRKPDKIKNVKIDLLGLCFPLGSMPLDLMEDQTFESDFIEAYKAILGEFSDYTFRQVSNRGMDIYSKFVKEHLLFIFYIEKRTGLEASSGEGGKDDHRLVFQILCMKCVSDKIPAKNCKYMQNQFIWANKMVSQLTSLLQNYFLSDLSAKLQRNVQMDIEDLERVKRLCKTKPIEVDITGYCKKLRSLFGSGGKLGLAYAENLSRIFRHVIKFFLTKVNLTKHWYFIYKHPDSQGLSMDRDFGARDKQIGQMMKNSKNSSFEWDANSFLMMRLSYTSSNGHKIQCNDAEFLGQIVEQAYRDSLAPQEKKIIAKIILTNYSPVNKKEISSKNKGFSGLTTWTDKVLEFEENCADTYKTMEETFIKTSIFTMFRRFFNFLVSE